MKVVINGCYGGFGLSVAAIHAYAAKKGITLYEQKDEFNYIYYYTDPTFEDDSFFGAYGIERTDPALVEVVEELGEEANGDHAQLRVVEIPDDVEWTISEYDGIEHIAEVHRTWC